MTSEAETGLAPPAIVVIVSTVGLPSGFTTRKTVLATVVVINLVPVIWLVPVALPTTVVRFSDPLSSSTS